MKTFAWMRRLLALVLLVASALAMAQGAPATRSFDHIRTGYPLTGQHLNERCESCHINGIFKGTPRDCASCHTAGTRWSRSNIVKGQNHIPTQLACASCHNTRTYAGARFNHAGVTAGSCTSCHNGSMAPGAGTEVAVELQGWNLLVDKLKVDALYDRGRPLRWYTVKQTEEVSVRVPLAIDMMPETQDLEPNNDREHAQPVTLPIIVNGRIDQPGDCDAFQFEASGKLVAEVYARRFGSPVDSMLRLTDADGKQVASNDDYEYNGNAVAHPSCRLADSRFFAGRRSLFPAVGGCPAQGRTYIE